MPDTAHDTAGSPAPPRDPGLQPERTRLSWRRITLAYAAVTLLAIRAVLNGRTGSPAAVLTAALLALTWLAFLATAHRRLRSLTASRRPATLSPRTAAFAVACTIALAVGGAAIIL